MLRSTYGGRNDDLTEKDVVAIKNELAKREHVPTKAQSTLIRKMSQKAGKRLTLKQAQLMKNKENKK